MVITSLPIAPGQSSGFRSPFARLSSQPLSANRQHLTWVGRPLPWSPFAAAHPDHRAKLSPVRHPSAHGRDGNHVPTYSPRPIIRFPVSPVHLSSQPLSANRQHLTWVGRPLPWPPFAAAHPDHRAKLSPVRHPSAHGRDGNLVPTYSPRPIIRFPVSPVHLSSQPLSANRQPLPPI
jgi:hypothetical protein